MLNIFKINFFYTTLLLYGGRRDCRLSPNIYQTVQAPNSAFLYHNTILISEHFNINIFRATNFLKGLYSCTAVNATDFKSEYLPKPYEHLIQRLYYVIFIFILKHC